MNTNVLLLPGSMSEEDALMCDDPITSLIARLTVSSAHVGLVDFLNAEMKRPGANGNDILIGIAAYMVQMHASMAAYFVTAGGVDAVMRQFQAVFDRTYREHFVDSAKEIGNG